LIESRRRKFNERWTPDKRDTLLALLQDRFAEPPQFPISETPCFFAPKTIDRMGRYGIEIVDELLANEQYQQDSAAAIPDRYRVPNESAFPLFVQADFGFDRDLQPRLVEIQGFPSLYAYQPMLADCYREAFELDPALQDLPGGLGRDRYNELLRNAIVGGSDPENVILMEIDPTRQKTRHDFVATDRLFGVRAVDVRELRREGRRLVYQRDGRDVPVHRIYNRMIIDEVERRGIELPFDLRDDLDVEWAGHPNWFFRLSKFSLPYVRHPSVPRTTFLSEAQTIADPRNVVVKPLYSFAGVGVMVGPTREQIDAIPPDRRGDYIVQERIDFRPVIDTPYGPTMAEVRIMYIWLHGGLRPINTVIRMGRGAQMGVDHNRNMEWVGGSAAFVDPAAEEPKP
jgi:hypothetical protein